jgi:hypothetical protein
MLPEKIALQYQTIYARVLLYHNPLQRAGRLIDERITSLCDRSTAAKKAMGWLKDKKIACLTRLKQSLDSAFQTDNTQLPGDIINQHFTRLPNDELCINLGLLSNKSATLVETLEAMQPTDAYIVERDAARLICENLIATLINEQGENDPTKAMKINALNELIKIITDKTQFEKPISQIVTEFKKQQKGLYDSLIAGLNQPRGKQLIDVLQNLHAKCETNSRLSFERTPLKLT